MVTRARDAGVYLMLTVGVDAASSRRAVSLAGRLPGVAAAAGLHPQRVRRPGLAHELDAVFAVLMAQRPMIAAVGEVGLHPVSSGGRERPQERAFDAQLRMAAQAALPVVVHSAGGHARTAELLAPLRRQLPAVIVHYFVGDEADLRRFLDLDCYISFGRTLLKPGQETLRAVARLVPPDRLLVETDTYPLPGRTTEPRDVVAVVRALAALRGEPEEVTAGLTVANCRRALGFDDEPRMDANPRRE